jgi:serine/threonine-protein kinase
VIRVAVDDLAFVTADAVVRPATARLDPTTPALRRLEQVGGAAFWGQLTVQQDLGVGAAVVTAGGDLPAQFVIHAIIMSATEPITPHGIRRALRSSLQRAVDWAFASLAVPLVGTGAGGVGAEEAAAILCDELHTHLQQAAYPTDVCIVVEREEERAMVEGLLRQ